MKEQNNVTSTKKQKTTKELNIPVKAKKQIKVNDILIKVTSKQLRYGKDKKSIEEVESHQKEDSKDSKKVAESPKSRQRKQKSIMDYEISTAKEKNIKNKKLNSSEVSKPSVVDKIEEKNTKSSKQLTISDMFSNATINADSGKPEIEEPKLSKTNIESEILSASPGEYEGGDEDGGGKKNLFLQKKC